MDRVSESYYAGVIELETIKPLDIDVRPKGIGHASNSNCKLNYQFSTDGKTYKFWNGSKWSIASSSSDVSSIESASKNLASLAKWPNKLYAKIFMQAKIDVLKCDIKSLSVY